MPDGMIGYGSKVRIGVGETPDWTPLALVGDIEMPDEQADKVEVTHMASPGRRKQFIAGMVDGGELSIPINYIPGNDTDLLLKSLRASREEVILGITITPDGTEETYSAYLGGYSRSVPVGDKMTATATFVLSAEVALS